MRVVVIGGGVAALELVLALRELAEERVEIEVIAPERDFVYRPLAVAEPFGIGGARRFDLDRLLHEQNARRHAALAESVETGRQVVLTAGGGAIPYDVLVVAIGARPYEAVPGALTVGVGDGFARLGDALRRLREHERIVFTVPGATAWTLPLYELALLTATAHPEVDIVLVTPEDVPLRVFGTSASLTVARRLEERGIELMTGRYPVAAEEGELKVTGAPGVLATLVVAMAGLRGPDLAGLPSDPSGFIPVDDYGRVRGENQVWAAGDATTFPVKQGGLAAQQALTVAGAVAKRAGADVDPVPFEPILRGLLLTGTDPEYLRAELKGGTGVMASQADVEPLWWPPNKIAALHSSHLLARIAAAEPVHGEDPFTRLETDDLEHLLRKESNDG